MSEIQEHPKHSSRIHWTDQTTNLETDTANLVYKTGLTSQYHSISMKLDTNLQTSILGYVFTFYRIAFTPARKSYRIQGFCLPTRTVVEARFLWRSDAAPRRPRKWSVKYRRGVTTLTKAVWAVLWITLCPPGNFVDPPEFFGSLRSADVFLVVASLPPKIKRRLKIRRRFAG